MINVEKFYHALNDESVEYFAGVPDSLLKHFCAYLSDQVQPDKHVITANEGAAVGLAAGYHLATGQVPMIYLQNSGLGNIINPLLSLADDEVYGVPMLFLIGWRGQPGVKDEPQHIKQGRVTQDLLDQMEVPYIVINADTQNTDSEFKEVRQLIALAKKQMRPVAILVEKGTFNKAIIQNENPANSFNLSREDAIQTILEQIPKNSVVVSTTGMISREVYEIREKLNQSHEKDFLTVGSMGHASQIALGIASQQPERPVYCLDGDGSVIMHMGSLIISGTSKQPNLVHIMLNNGAHDSVGGQPTKALSVNMTSIAHACGYPLATRANDSHEIEQQLTLSTQAQTPSFIEIPVAKGNRADLGRPTSTPKENKSALMTYLHQSK